jgi:hypothetical protein
MSTISAGTSSGTALVSTGDTTGALVFQTNGTTTAVTIGTNQVVTLAQPLPVASGGTGGSATPTAGGIVYGTGTVQAVSAAGTSGQLLQSNGASAPTWATVSAGFTLGTPAATTSGTSVTFTGIPAGVKQVVVTFKGVSTNGTSPKLVRIGPIAGVETSGYGNNQLSAPGGVLTRNYNNSGALFGGVSSANVISGSMIFTLQNSTTNSWAVQGGQQEYSSEYTPYFNAGIVSLSGALSVLSITTDNGTDTFDAGQVNIAYI